MVLLGVNIDHVATLRQARRGDEPDPAWAAAAAQLAGAGSITLHLREDRRHVQDHDLDRVMGVTHGRVNLEMAATPAMVELACERRPAMVTLVPEGRMEVTTEGGLDVAALRVELTAAVGRLAEADIPASAFIDPDPRQVAAARDAGFQICELHTGPYALAFARSRTGSIESHDVRRELDLLEEAGDAVRRAGMLLNAGHALTYRNVGPVAAMPGMHELHIGHSIVSRAVFTGFDAAVREMIHRIREAST